MASRDGSLVAIPPTNQRALAAPQSPHRRRWRCRTGGHAWASRSGTNEVSSCLPMTPSPGSPRRALPPSSDKAGVRTDRRCGSAAITRSIKISVCVSRRMARKCSGSSYAQATRSQERRQALHSQYPTRECRAGSTPTSLSTTLGMRLSAAPAWHSGFPSSRGRPAPFPSPVLDRPDVSNSVASSSSACPPVRPTSQRGECGGGRRGLLRAAASRPVVVMGSGTRSRRVRSC
jgi:hypothetical protein